MHKDDIFNDYMFTMAYYLALQPDGSSENIFPTFEAFCLDVSEKSDSKMAGAFRRKWEIIYEMAKKYCEDQDALELEESINEFLLDGIASTLGSHGAKKFGIQKMGDMMSLTIQDISMRGGWALKSFNTFFDYWVGSYAASERTGKILAGWTTRSDNGYHGGHPPSMNDIETMKDSVPFFVQSLFGHHLHVSEEMQLFFCANLLRHWPQFRRVVESEPRGAFVGNNFTKHPFVHQVEIARAAAHISPSDFEKWVEEINKGFIQNNINCIPLKV